MEQVLDNRVRDSTLDEDNRNMGSVIELANYRKKKQRTEPEQGYSMHMEPPFLIVRHFHNGILLREERLLHGSNLRDYFDFTQ